jgi:hypothetical protein
LAGPRAWCCRTTVDGLFGIHRAYTVERTAQSAMFQ